jgi:methylglyoxal synthase
MITTFHQLAEKKHIALIAHDASKAELLTWVMHNQEKLCQHQLFATGSTGKMITDATKLSVYLYKSGPLGGDMQIGAQIVEGKIDFLIFFWDPLEAQPHDPDIKALLRLAVLYDIPTACNQATADFLITSPFMSKAYQRSMHDYGSRPTESTA